MSTTARKVWTDELREEAALLYQEKINVLPEEERPAASLEIVKEVAEELGFKPNGVRITLQKQGVYISATKPPKAAAATSEGGSKRVSKADAQAELVGVLTDLKCTIGEELDEQIKKATGKFCQLLAAALRDAE